jgi:hypothetical protein
MRANGTTLAFGVLLGSAVIASPMTAQSTDPTVHWSLFGGTVPTEDNGLGVTSRNVALGGSAELRLSRFPLPLRATLSFDQSEQQFGGAKVRFGALSLDAIGRPVPKLLGTQLYFLGGLGVGTRASFTQIGKRLVSSNPDQFEYFPYKRARDNWTFVEGGAGLELGHAFIQWKLQMPVASEGYVRAPVSVGFRF